MQIAQIIVGLNVGGAEKMLERLVLKGQSANLNNIVISLTDLGEIGESLKSKGVIVEVVNLTGLKNVVPCFIRLRRLLKFYNPIIEDRKFHKLQ